MHLWIHAPERRRKKNGVRGLRFDGKEVKATVAATSHIGTKRTAREYVIVDLNLWTRAEQLRVADEVSGRHAARALVFDVKKWYLTVRMTFQPTNAVLPPDAMLRPFSNTLPLLALLLILDLAACASTENSSTGQSSRSGVYPDRIVIDELPISVSGLSVFEVVRQYRPQWLRKRGPTSINAPTEVSVYLDTNRSRFGPPSSLRRLRAVNAASVEHLSGSEAHAEYGLNNVHGAIVVHMRDGR